ncbi:stage II sporulation protein P [Paenibacillus motobuensis]|uniref:stage II sporulation protein P n=1 Tax=Paenibacillus TaxID=44249 RepID=UPI00203E8849|nr:MULTISPECIES: stage II sporulation protein P [Paenibacillus]MCM3042423.1 stage II sporulation protein P [Paenibacillus lutimineralis]MCM3649527.1 stage II sporulation protein P [Paenibacillus motobuensis]
MPRFKMWRVAVCVVLLLGSANGLYASGQAHAAKGSATEVKTVKKQSTKPSDNSKKIEYARSTVERLNVRTEPNLKAAVIQLIGKQNTYQVLDKKGKWIKIKLAKSDGWVHTDYIEYVKDGNKGTVKDETKIVKNETKAVKNETKAVKDETKAVKDETKVVKDETKVVKDETKVVKDETKVVKDETKVVKQEQDKFQSGQEEKPQTVEQNKPDQAADGESDAGDKSDSVVKIVDVTNLRVGPGMDFEIVGKAQPGESYTIVESDGEWFKVALQDGNTAYIAGWVVQIGSANDAQDTAGQSNAEVNYENQVFIYSSHNRESWRSVARNVKGSSVDDRDINIATVGRYLGDVLQEKGVPTFVNNIDIARRLEEQRLSYSKSYEESRRAINTALKTNPSLTYFLDIHRDSDVPKQTTTTSINGESYARILFVIGTNHSNYAKNKQFADALNELLKQNYPGISRGVLLKSAKQGNGEYNQSVSTGSLLIEIGGANNTFQESQRAAEALADVFSQYYHSKK